MADNARNMFDDDNFNPKRVARDGETLTTTLSLMDSTKRHGASDNAGREAAYAEYVRSIRNGWQTSAHAPHENMGGGSPTPANPQTPMKPTNITSATPGRAPIPMHDDTNTSTAPTVLHHAERLLGRVPILAGKTDAEIRRVVVGELLDIHDIASRSDAFVDGAFGTLASGDSRLAVTRRRLRLEARKRLRDAQPMGHA
jgi:hypothetical protein